jgi:hypothetical protein
MTRGTAAGGVLPIGINVDAFEELTFCDTEGGCDPEDLTPGTRIQPGQFGWLSFGADPKKCDPDKGAPGGYGLGMLPEGCENSQGFLQNEIGTNGPNGNSHGCCTSIDLTPPAARNIKGLTGNEWGDLSWYVTNRVPVWVPIWDTTGGTGSNAYYHIVGFAAIMLTSEGDGSSEHAKWLEGVRLSGIGATPNAFGLVGVTGEVYLVR